MSLFGTDGIRDRAGQGALAPDQVRRLAVALGKLLRTQPEIFSAATGDRSAVLIGRDTRPSGEAIEGQITSGLIGSGNEVWTAGVAPTPAVAYLTRAWSCALGVAITASHNPAEDNGIKLISPEGFKIPDAAEREIERLCGEPALEEPSDPSTTVYRRVTNRVDEYLWFLRERLGGTLSGRKIVLDCANGATSALAPKLFQGLGARVVAVNADGQGARINRDAAVLKPELLVDRVLQEGADLGAAYDGDGDRCILIDESGNVCDGDYLLAVASLGLPKGSTVVSTVMANHGLETWLRDRGLELRRVPVGDRYVADEMRRCGAKIGGEQSGHLIFADASPAGDGLLTTVMTLRSMRERSVPLSKLCPGFRRFPQVLVNVPVREKPPIETVAPLARAIREAEASLQGRVLVRYSGTEPLCRIMVEGRDEDAVQRAADSLATVVRQNIG